MRLFSGRQIPPFAPSAPRPSLPPTAETWPILLASSGSRSTMIARPLTNPSAPRRGCPALPNRMPERLRSLAEYLSAAILQRARIATYAPATPGIPLQSLLPRSLGTGVLSPFRPAPDSSAAACAGRIASELSRSKPIRGLLPEPMTKCATSVLPSPSARHYPVRKRAPRDLAMSHAANPSEYRGRAKRYAVLRAWGLSPYVLCPSALFCDVLPLSAARCPVHCYPV